MSKEEVLGIISYPMVSEFIEDDTFSTGKQTL